MEKSDTFHSSAESGDLNSASSGRVVGWVETDKRIFGYQGDKKRSTAQETIVHKPNDRTDALSTAHIPSVLVTPKPTNTQSPSTSAISPVTQTSATSLQSTLPNFPISTFSLVDFLAKLFQSLEKEKGLPTPEELSSLKSPELQSVKDLAFCYLKTSRGFSVTTEGLRFGRLFPPLMSWGMTSNGKCLTAKISAFPKTGNACSLSDILEERADPKYFLSPEAMKRLMQFGMRTTTKEGIAGTVKARTGGPQNDERYLVQ